MRIEIEQALAIRVPIGESMTRFLFWNLNRKSVSDLVAKVAHEYMVDVLMLAECDISPSEVLLDVNSDSDPYFEYVPSIDCDKIEVFVRFPEKYLRPLFDGPRMTIRQLMLPGVADILLAITHLPSKLHWSEADQTAYCFSLAQSIRRVEEDVGHSRTILVGDLNMNPFEEGVVGAMGLHGVMTTQIANRQHRVIQKEEYPFFYNPMWSLLGKESPGPPGTFYHAGSEPVNYFWNMFDQVLVRPEIIQYFRHSALKIVTSLGSTSFLTTSGTINRSAASDHLPILFQVDL